MNLSAMTAEIRPRFNGTAFRITPICVRHFIAYNSRYYHLTGNIWAIVVSDKFWLYSAFGYNHMHGALHLVWDYSADCPKHTDCLAGSNAFGWLARLLNKFMFFNYCQ
jgi:hypothetical protein